MGRKQFKPAWRSALVDRFAAQAEIRPKPLICKSISNAEFDHVIQNRKWLFIGFDLDDNETYLGAGGSDDENQSAIFIGTCEEANKEAENRGNAWQDRTGKLLSKIVLESQGVVWSNGQAHVLADRERIQSPG